MDCEEKTAENSPVPRPVSLHSNSLLLEVRFLLGVSRMREEGLPYAVRRTVHHRNAPYTLYGASWVSTTMCEEGEDLRL